MEKHAHPPRVVYCALYSTLTRFTKFRVLNLHITSTKYMSLIRCTNVFFQGRLSRHIGTNFSPILPPGGYSHFCGYIGEAPASNPKPKKLLRFADHPQKIPVLSGIPQKILELLAYPKKLHVFIFFMPIDEILSHLYDLSCWWDVKSQIKQPTEHVTIQFVYVGTRK